MTSEGARLKAHLKLVGEAKAESHREATAAHLARSPGERLEDAVRWCDAMIALARETASLRPNPVADDEDEAWARVYQKLHRHERDRR